MVALIDAPAVVGQVVNIGNGKKSQSTSWQRGHNPDPRQLGHRRGSREQAYDAGFEVMPLRVPAISKITALIGYEPPVELDEILARMVQ